LEVSVGHDALNPKPLCLVPKLATDTKPPKVDGGWGSWSSFSQCSKSCGTGVQFRYRACDNPPPSHGGAPCVGQNITSQFCNKHECSTTTTIPTTTPPPECKIAPVLTKWTNSIFGSRQPHEPLTEDPNAEFTCWNPLPESPSHFVLSSIPVKGHHIPNSAYTFNSSDPSVFHDPIDFKMIFHETGGKNSIWEAVCPSSYMALGQWCQNLMEKPKLHNTLKCVKKICLTPCPYKPIYNWKAELLSVFRSTDTKVQGLEIATGSGSPHPVTALCLS